MISVRLKGGSMSAEALRARLDERFRGPLMSFFLRRVGDGAEAEDLTQEVFVRLLGAAERQPIEDVEALVAEVTREFVEDRDPERVLLARESYGEVLAALDELSQRTRDIYVLFRLENMKQKEIAALFGIARSTVEKEVMKATLHLALRCGPRRR